MTRTEPILYKKVMLGSESEARRFMTCLRQRQSPHSFAQAAVKRLCMFSNTTPTIALEILEHCMGITTLAIWIQSAFADSARMQEYVDALPFLMELSLNMSSIFCSTTPSFATLDIAHRITRLEILDRWILWTSTVGIEEMIWLTHLVFNLHLWHSCAQHIQRILHRCSTLKVILLQAYNSQNEVNTWLETRGIHDIWIVWTDNSVWINWDILGLDEEPCNLWDYVGEIVAWWRQNDSMYQDHIQDEEY